MKQVVCKIRCCKQAYTGFYVSVCARWNLENKQPGLGIDNVRNALPVEAVGLTEMKHRCIDLNALTEAKKQTKSFLHKAVELSLPAHMRETACCAEYAAAQRAEEGKETVVLSEADMEFVKVATKLMDSPFSGKNVLSISLISPIQAK